MARRVTVLAMTAAVALGASIAGAPPATAVRATTPATLDPAYFGTGLGALSIASGDTVSFDTITGQIVENGTIVRLAGNDSVVNGIGVETNAASTGITAFYFGPITVAAGATITATGGNPLGLLSTGAVTIAGTVDVDGLGAAANAGLGAGHPGTCAASPNRSSGGGGGAFGSVGGTGGAANTAFGGTAGATYGPADLFASPVLPVGSGGGNAAAAGACGTVESGGRGGGSVAIVALGTADLSGAIVTAKGTTPTAVACSAGAGGGSGGSVMIVAPQYVDNASTSFRVSGGPGGTASSCSGGTVGGGGGGGGGRLTVLAEGTRAGAVNSTAPLGGAGASGGVGGANGGVPTTFDGPFVTLSGPPTGVATTPVTFTASVAVGAVESYEWDFGDGTRDISYDGSDVHRFRRAATFLVTVKAFMSGTETPSAASTPIVVSDHPINGVTASNDGPTPLGARTRFTATQTGGTGPITYQWDFGDGQSGNGATPFHHYDAPGTYTATVTASGTGGQVSASTTVVVKEPLVSIGSPTVAEGTAPLPGGARYTVMRFTINLSARSPQTVTVTAATSAGSAHAPSDYRTKSATVTFARGALVAHFTVNVVPDARPEPDETFTVTLSNPVNAALGTASGTGTIVDDD